MFAIFRTQRFDKEFLKKLSKEEQREVENFEKKQLTENPFVGDPLGVPFFREKKIKGKRIYYLVYKHLRSVLMVGISDKRSQQDTINEIKSKLNEYYLTIEEALKQHDEFDHV